MAADFRSLLTIIDADDPTASRYDDINIGEWFILSIQARPLYDDSPMELGDPADYDIFHLTLMTQGGVISYGSWGAWEDLQNKPWAERFRQEFPILLVAEDVPADVVQEIVNDLEHYSTTHKAPVNKKKRRSE